MPQAAWEALLWDAVHGPPPPLHPQKPSAAGSRSPTPRHGPWAPHRPYPHPITTTPGRERARGGSAAMGRGEQGSRQAPTGTGHRGRHNTRARNHQRARKGKGQRPRHSGRGRNGGHQAAHTGRARHTGRTSTAQPSADSTRPPEAHARQDAPPSHGPDAAQTAPARAHRPADPAQGKEGTPIREKCLHPPREPPGTPSRSPPPQPHRQATTPATARVTTQATARAPEEEEDTAATPRTGDSTEAEGQDRRGPNTAEEATTPRATEPNTPLLARTPRGHGTKAQAPREGKRRGHPPNPPGRMAHPDPRNRDPTSHTTPNGAPQPPASQITSSRVTHHEAGQSNQRQPHPRQYGSEKGPPRTMAQQNTAQ